MEQRVLIAGAMMRGIQVRELTVSTLLLLAVSAVGCAADSDPNETEGNADSADLAIESPAAAKVLKFSYQVQQTGYWCGPAATRMALSVRISPPSQQQLANELPTDTDGTDRITQVTRVMNKYIGGYFTVEMPNSPPSAAQKGQLWADIVRSIDAGYSVVTNIVATPSNRPPGYPNKYTYHYFTVMGYNPETSQVYIGDSANFSGMQQYWLSFDQLARLIPPKGYSAWAPKGTTCPGGNGTVVGAIEAKYKALGGCGGFLGVPVTEELPVTDRVGRYSAFTNGTIYWHPSTGAFEVHGPIRDRYRELGWETSILKYPTTDQVPTSDGRGQKSVFQGGGIYWSEATGAREVYGDIRAKWISLGEEKSPLGLPTSGEYAIPGGRRNDFEKGSISWNASNRETTVTINAD